MLYNDVSPEEFQDLPEILKPTEVAKFMYSLKSRL